MVLVFLYIENLKKFTPNSVKVTNGIYPGVARTNSIPDGNVQIDFK